MIVEGLDSPHLDVVDRIRLLRQNHRGGNGVERRIGLSEAEGPQSRGQVGRLRRRPDVPDDRGDAPNEVEDLLHRTLEQARLLREAQAADSGPPPLRFDQHAEPLVRNTLALLRREEKEVGILRKIP